MDSRGIRIKNMKAKAIIMNQIKKRQIMFIQKEFIIN
jgi:hypothetical protein